MSNTSNPTLVVNLNTGEGLSPDIFALPATERMDAWLHSLRETALSPEFLLKRTQKLDLTLEGTQHNLASLSHPSFFGAHLVSLTITETQEKSIPEARRITIDALLESALLNQGHLKHLSLQSIGYPNLGCVSKAIEAQRELLLRGWFLSEEDDLFFFDDDHLFLFADAPKEPVDSKRKDYLSAQHTETSFFDFRQMVHPLHEKILQQDMLACQLESLEVTVSASDSTELPLYLVPKSLLPSLKHLSILFDAKEAVSPYPFFTSLTSGAGESEHNYLKSVALANSVCSQLESLALNGLYLPGFVHGSVYPSQDPKTLRTPTLSVDTSPLEEDRKVISTIKRQSSDLPPLLGKHLPDVNRNKVADLKGVLSPAVCEATRVSRQTDADTEDFSHASAEYQSELAKLNDALQSAPVLKAAQDVDDEYFTESTDKPEAPLDPVDIQLHLHDNYPHSDYRDSYADLAAVPRTGSETLTRILGDIKDPALKSLRKLSLTGWQGAVFTPDIVNALLTSLKLKTLVLTEDPRVKYPERDEIQANFPDVEVLWEG